MNHHTKQENEALVCKLLEFLITGGTHKEFASLHKLKQGTLHKLVKLTWQRNGFRTLYQMLAAYITVKEQARKGKIPSK